MPDVIQTVEIEIPQEAPNKQELEQSANENTILCGIDNCQESFPADLEILKGHIREKHPIKEDKQDTNRNDKGQFVEGNTASVGNKGGRPCEYCQDKEKYDTLIGDYVKKSLNRTGEKVSIPWIEEVALILDKDEETLKIWSKKKIKDQDGKETDELEHPEFSALYKKVNLIQKLRLQQRVIGRFNPTGAMGLLKWHHGMIETEKKIVTGDTNEPLVITIVDDKQKVQDE